MHSDQRLSVQLTAELNGNKMENCNKGFGIEIFFSKIVTQILIDEQKKKCWLHASSHLLNNKEMPERVITRDEAWCFQYASLCSKQKSMSPSQFKIRV